MDTARNDPQIDALLARAEQHLRDRDAPALFQDLKDLAPCKICSGNDAYTRWEAIREDVVRCLYEELPFERFLEISLSESVLEAYEVLEVVDSCASLEQAMQMADRFDELPDGGSRLFQLIASEPGEEVTRWCIAWAERAIAATEAWECPSAATPLLLVAERGDEAAREKVESWMEDPPWKSALSPTRALLWSASPPLLEKAAQNRSLPIESRLQAMGDLPNPIERALTELLRASDPRERDRILLWLDRGPWTAEAAAPHDLAKADLRSWSLPQRELLDMLLKKNAPEWARPRSPGLAGRLSLQIIRLFERIRAPMMGCGFFCCVLAALFAGYNFLLDLALGPPTSQMGVNALLGALALAIFAIGSTARPDMGASLEGITQRFHMGLFLLVALAFALLAPVLVRL